jgi:hypothetical protein
LAFIVYVLARIELNWVPRMPLDRAGPLALIAAALVLAAPSAGRAGGTGFTDEDLSNTSDGPAFFGFVREVGGAGIADAKVTAEVKDRGALVTRTDIMGVYKIPGFGQDVKPDDVTISCAKDGYKQADVQRQPHAAGDIKDPIEVECYLQKQ